MYKAGVGGDLFQAKFQREYFNKPRLEAHLEFYRTALWELDGDRYTDYGPIAFTAMVQYGELYGIEDVDEFDRFKFIIRSMDRTLSDLRAEKAKQPPPKFEKE
jgi:hypothetical protein